MTELDDAPKDSPSAPVPDDAPDNAVVAATDDAPADTPADRDTSYRLDRWLTISLWVVGVATVLFAAFFAYNVYAHYQAVRLTSPALLTIDAARRAVEKTPDDLILRVQLAAALGAAGMLEEGKAQLAVVIKADPKNLAAFQTLAQIELLQKDYANAKRHLQKILDLTDTGGYQNVNQRRDTAFFHLGEIALIEKEYADAVGYLKAALRIRKDASDTYLRLAQAYSGLDAPDKAMEQLDIALAFDPRLAEAHYEKGKLLIAQGDKVNAAWEFRAALDGAPESREAQAALDSLGTYREWYDKAKAAFKAGQMQPALDAVRIARAIDPTSFDAAMLNGEILEQMGEFSAAADAYAIAVMVRPDDKPATVALTRSIEASETKGAK
jgi:tetratricopeptide (TPR) repeat protein